MIRSSLAIVAMLCAFASSSALAADQIRIGVLKVTSIGPVFIAQEKGYFAKENLAADLVFVEQPGNLAQGVVTGDLDVGLVALTAAFFNLSAHGALRIVAGNTDESPGFQASATIVSNRAYAAGLKALKDLGGHSFAVPGPGGPPQYALAVLAAKYGFHYQSVKMLPVGTLPNVVTAIVGGSADSTIMPAIYLKPALQRNDAQNLGWISDDLRMQIQVAAVAGKTAEEKPDFVRRFLNAYRAGARDYHDAFIGPGETRQDGPTAPETYAILAKYLGQPIDILKLGVAHLDAAGRLDVGDVLHQIDWYKSQGMVKPEVDGNVIIDSRFVVPLPR